MLASCLYSALFVCNIQKYRRLPEAGSFTTVSHQFAQPGNQPGPGVGRQDLYLLDNMKDSFFFQKMNFMVK